MNEEVFNVLGENGFVIDKTSEFLRATEDVDLKALVEELTALEKKANAPFDVLNFSKNIMDSIESIDAIIKKDDFANLSDKENIDNCQNIIKKFRDSFSFIGEYIISERNLKQREEDYFKVKSEILRLDKRTDLTPALKTRETLRLRSEESICKNAYLEALNLLNENKKKYEEVIVDFDLNKFKNALLAIINDLNNSISNIALSTESKTNLEVIINDIRNNTVYYGLDKVNLKNEFENKCKKYSLKYVGKEEAMVKEEVETEEIDESFSEIVDNSHSIWSPTDQNTEKEGKKKDSINWLLNELKRLNPDNKFELGNVSDARYDAKITCDKDIRSIILPYGYYFTSNSITNRFSADEDVLNVEIGLLKEEEKSEIMSTTQEEYKPTVETPEFNSDFNYNFDNNNEPIFNLDVDQNIFDKPNKIDYPKIGNQNSEHLDDERKNTSADEPTANVENKLLPDKSGIPLDEKLKIKRTRKAKMASGVSKLLKASAIVSLGVTCAVVPTNAMFLVAACSTIGAMISDEYVSKIKTEGIVEPQLEKENIPKTWEGLKKIVPLFQNGYKKIMSLRKNKAEEDLKDLDEQVEEVVGNRR